MTFSEIERMRVARALTPTAMCRLAGVPNYNYWRIRSGKVQASRRTLQAWHDALAGQGGRFRKRIVLNPALIRAVYRSYVSSLCAENGTSPRVVFAMDPARRATADKIWAACARIRALAVYCVIIELAVPGKQVAEAIGITRQAVSEMLRRVEDFREDPDVDALLERVGCLISGRVVA